MRAHAEQLIKLISLNGAVFNIPVYQRNYDWKIEQCGQLFDDLETIVETNKNHFIGSVVYVSVGSWGSPSFNIIDGQQRITTVMLLLRALYDSSDNDAFKQNIMRNLLINSAYDGGISLRLKQVETDSVVYDKLVSSVDMDEAMFSHAEKMSNVYQNYQYFMQRIYESEHTVAELFQAIYRFDIIDVCLDNEDPQAVFESLNSTGMSLKNTDLLRNYLLMAVPRERQEYLYKQYWTRIEQNVGVGNVEQFMIFYLIMVRKSDGISFRGRKAKIGASNLYDAYKQYFSLSGKTAEEFLSDACGYSYIFKRFVNENRLDSDMNVLLYELMDVLSTSSAAIFLMYLFNIQKVDNISDEDMIMAVNACTSYVVRKRVVMNRRPSINQFFALCIQQFDKFYQEHSFIDSVWLALTFGQGTYAFPSNAEFQETLENRNIYEDFKSGFLIYLLYRFERARTKEIVDCSDGVTIEHVLPRNADQWRDYLVNQRDAEYENYIHTLGNLTLTKYNSEMSNKSFDEKKQYYINSGFALNREIAGMLNWNSRVIKERSKRLAKEALSIWPLPQQYNAQAVATDMFAMDDDVSELYEDFRSVMKDCYPNIIEMSASTHINYVYDNCRLFSLVPNMASLYVTFNVESDIFDGRMRVEPYSRHRGVGAFRAWIKNEDDIWAVVDCVEILLRSYEADGVIHAGWHPRQKTDEVDASLVGAQTSNNNGLNNGDLTSVCVGKLVVHKVFGVGKIVELTDSHIIVKFDDSKKMFGYPAAFTDGHLALRV